MSPVPSPDPPQDAPSGQPTCRCGHTKGHPLVIPEAQYSLFHFCLGIFMGASAGQPKRVLFRCQRCGQVVEESTDPVVLNAHR